MLYELVGIVRPGKIAEVKDIIKTAGMTILNSKGVVRGITNWGTFALPKPTRDTSAASTQQTSSSNKSQRAKTQTTAITPQTGDETDVPTITQPATLDKTAPQFGRKHYAGHYFVLRWDSDSKTQHSIRRTMSLDPRIIRYTIVKMGTRLEDISDVGGKAEEWSSYGPTAALGQKWSERNAPISSTTGGLAGIRERYLGSEGGGQNSGFGGLSYTS